jgi:hypothetical protein
MSYIVRTTLHAAIVADEAATPPISLISWVLSSVTGALALQIPRPGRRVLILAQPPRLVAYLTGPFVIDDLERVATNFSRYPSTTH